MLSTKNTTACFILKQPVYRPTFEVAFAVYRIQKPVANNAQISIHAPVKAANILNAVVSSTVLGSPILPFDSTGDFFSYISGPVPISEVLATWRSTSRSSTSFTILLRIQKQLCFQNCVKIILLLQNTVDVVTFVIGIA